MQRLGATVSAVALVVCLALPVQSVVANVAITDLLREPEFLSVYLSPDGEHIAVTIPREDRTAIAVIRVSDNRVVGSWDHGSDKHVGQIWWVNDSRLLLQVGVKVGRFDRQVAMRGLVAVDIDGGRRQETNGAAVVLGRVRNSEDEFWLQYFRDNQVTLARLNAGPRSGRLIREAIAPEDVSTFLIDHNDQLRYAVGVGEDNRYRVYSRRENGWDLTQEMSEGGFGRLPVGLSSDGERVYFVVSEETGPDRLVLVNPADGSEELVSSTKDFDPSTWLWSGDGADLLAVGYQADRPFYDIITPEHPEAVVLVSLQRSFPDHVTQIVSQSEDGSRIVFRTYNDRDPGSYYLYDANTRSARFLLAPRGSLDPEAMASTQPIEFSARDGYMVRGYLTVPRGAEARNLPTVVWVHGGPHGIRDTWGFDTDVQVLASRGYAVLQVNFRGSGGYGRFHEVQAYKNWGTVAIDDISDAVRWAIDQQIVDGERVCIFGASFGGYAALMSATRDPELYRCAIGYAGIYSLEEFRDDSDIADQHAGEGYFSDVLPDSVEEMRAQSPAHNLDRLRIPVMLVHGGIDRRVPASQFRLMESALEDAGQDAEETVYERHEGHGFVDFDNNVELYQRVFQFLGRHIGAGRR